jgi:hypothetical protein
VNRGRDNLCAREKCGDLIFGWCDFPGVTGPANCDEERYLKLHDVEVRRLGRRRSAVAATVTNGQDESLWADDGGPGREICLSPYHGGSREAYCACHDLARLQLRARLSTRLSAPDSYGTQPCNLRSVLHLARDGCPRLQ